MNILKYNDSGESVKFLQRMLSEVMNLQLKADGVFGKLTEEALRLFQKENNLPVTGIYAAKEIFLLQPKIDSKYLKQQDIEDYASSCNLPASILKAMRQVGARSEGFLYNGNVIILFERHKFFQNLVRSRGNVFAFEVSKHNPDICNPERGGYLGYTSEYSRFSAAATIDRVAAISSTSYGLFQICGKYFKECGFHDIESFLQAMKISEKLQFDAFIKFIHNDNRLLTALKQRNYLRIAELYNGPNSSVSDYANKLKIADTSFL